MKKWFLLHLPQKVLNLVIRILVMFPIKLRVRIFLFFADGMYKMSDEELQPFMHNISEAVFSLPSEDASYRFAQSRLQSLPHMPRQDAIRLIRFMARACQEGDLSQYTRDQAMMQKAIFHAPKDLQDLARDILTNAGATGSLPIELTINKKVNKKSRKVRK